MVDALADRGDEGRARLRKATVSCQEALTRGFPNGETRLVETPVTIFGWGEPGEVKHLSNRRKRNQQRFRK